MRPQRGWRALSGRKRRGALLAGRGGAWTSGRGGRKKENSRGVEGNAVWVGKAAGSEFRGPPSWYLRLVGPHMHLKRQQ
jgi:hypothetical protein